MKNKFKTRFLLISALTFGLVTTTALSSCDSEKVVEGHKLSFNFDEVPGIQGKSEKDHYKAGEMVKFKLEYNEEDVLVKGITISTGDQYFDNNGVYSFLMPDEEVTINVDCRVRVNLKGALEKLKAARNYTVVSRIDLADEKFDTIAYYTENAHMMHLESKFNVLRFGEINNEEGVYNFEISEDTKGNLVFEPTKVTYQSRKENVKSFWDPKHVHGGYQLLDLSYINEYAETYRFKDSEFGNISYIFYNTGLKLSTFLTVLESIEVSITKVGNVFFKIKLGKIGTVTSEVVNMGKTTIPLVDNFLNEGGEAIPSYLTDKQNETVMALSGNNYREPLPTVQYKNSLEEVVTIQQGTIYYHPNYLYVDYSDEFLKYINSKEGELTFKDNGYVQIHDKVYEFTMEDGTSGQEFKLNDDPDFIKTGELPKVAGYASETQFIKDFAYANSDRLYLSALAYLNYDVIMDFDVAYEAGIKIFHLDSNTPNDAMILTQSEGIGMTDLVNDNLLLIYITGGEAAATNYTRFGKTNIKFLEDKIAELEKTISA